MLSMAKPHHCVNFACPVVQGCAVAEKVIPSAPCQLSAGSIITGAGKRDPVTWRAAYQVKGLLNKQSECAHLAGTGDTMLKL